MPATTVRAAVAWPSSTARPQGVHITLNDLWENAYPYFFHVDFPALDDQNIGTSVASVGDMTGDGQPDIAIGAPHANTNGRIDAGSVWIISAPSAADRRLHPPGVARGGVCPWIKLNGLTAGQGYRIDGAAAGDQLGTSLAGLNGQASDRRRARRRTAVRAPARSSSSPASPARRRATWP